MDSETWVALLAAATAIASALYGGWSQMRVTKLTANLERELRREDREVESKRILARFREPLVHVAYDLQSRIFNILKLDFLDSYYTGGDDLERTYVVENTTFLVAQYFGWTEIIRREVQFLDLGEVEQTRNLSSLQDAIYHLWLTSKYGKAFRIFAGEQRAIGEQMMRESASGSRECVGYAEFLETEKLKDSPFLEKLRRDVHQVGEDREWGKERLEEMQRALIDLLEFLDPEYLRFPAERRSKV